MQKVEIDYMMRGHILSDDIEDVEYVDVSDPQPAQKAKRSYDKTARDKEISDQAAEFVRKRSNGLNPMTDLFAMSAFIHAQNGLMTIHYRHLDQAMINTSQ